MSDLPDLNKGELYRRLPELNNIRDPELENQLVEIFLDHAPEYFWTCPASSSGKYHPPDQRGKHGLWLHTKRAFTCFERLGRSYKADEKLTERQLDYGRAGILVHDLFKQGHEPRDEKHTSSDHDVIAYKYLKRETELPDEVLGCVVSHNGPWGEGRRPENVLEQVHHNADMIASDKNAFFKVQDPIPSEIQEIIENHVQKQKVEVG